MLTTHVTDYQNYINGKWVKSFGHQTFQSINPANKEDVVGVFQASNHQDVEMAVAAAQRAMTTWINTAPSKRASVLTKAADYLEEHLELFAEELTREEGKTIANSKKEIMRSAQTFRFYAVEGQTITGETFPNDDPDMTVSTEREPLGVVAVITPWNFPMSIPARKIAPALITGNTVVFKPSSDTPLVACRLVEALHQAGVPEGVINLITGSASDIGTFLISHPVIGGITFTGSTAAGEQIHKMASLTTRTQMELGGNNPLIVMDDADIDLAVKLTINGAFSLSGQACTGTSRVIIMKSVKDQYLSLLIEKTRNLKIGDGFTEGVDLGPLANEKQLNHVLKAVQAGVDESAHLIYGGKRLSYGNYRKGFYVEPAIFTDVTPAMRIAREEIFGPVISVIDVETYDEAINIANDVDYGLSASIITNDLSISQKFKKDIHAGTVKINRSTTGNLLNVPFGGLKKSSTSTFRESGRIGLDFFTQLKTIYTGL